MNGNPFHPVTMAMLDKWHAIAGLLMKASGLDAFEVTIVADTRSGKLVIRLATDQQVAAMVRDEVEGN